MVAAAAGGNHTCAQQADGAVFCWGWDMFGRLGPDAGGDQTTPHRIALE